MCGEIIGVTKTIPTKCFSSNFNEEENKTSQTLNF